MEMETNNRFVELIPCAYLHPSEVLLVGAWDIPATRLALHIRSARLNGTAPEPPTYPAIWVDSAGVVCGMTMGVN